MIHSTPDSTMSFSKKRKDSLLTMDRERRALREQYAWESFSNEPRKRFRSSVMLPDIPDEDPSSILSVATPRWSNKTMARLPVLLPKRSDSKLTWRGDYQQLLVEVSPAKEESICLDGLNDCLNLLSLFDQEAVASHDV